MKLDTKYSVGDRVWITELRLPARVTSVHIDHDGVTYGLRWFADNSIRTGYLFEDDLELPPESDKKIGLTPEK